MLNPILTVAEDVYEYVKPVGAPGLTFSLQTFPLSQRIDFFDEHTLFKPLAY